MLAKLVEHAEEDAKKCLMKAEQKKQRELEEGMMGLVQYRRGLISLLTCCSRPDPSIEP